MTWNEGDNGGFCLLVLDELDLVDDELFGARLEGVGGVAGVDGVTGVDGGVGGVSKWTCFGGETLILTRDGCESSLRVKMPRFSRLSGDALASWASVL